MVNKSQILLVIVCPQDKETDIVNALAACVKDLKSKNGAESGHLETSVVSVPIKLDL
jgi:hypothetical protein